MDLYEPDDVGMLERAQHTHLLLNLWPGRAGASAIVMHGMAWIVSHTIACTVHGMACMDSQPHNCRGTNVTSFFLSVMLAVRMSVGLQLDMLYADMSLQNG